MQLQDLKIGQKAITKSGFVVRRRKNCFVISENGKTYAIKALGKDFLTEECEITDLKIGQNKIPKETTYNTSTMVGCIRKALNYFGISAKNNQ